MVTETLLWKVQEIFPCRVSEKDQGWLMLWSFLMFHRGEPVLRSKPHPDPAFPPCSIHQTAKASTLTETTLKQLEVLSEMLRLMSKPNKNSKRLKANIVDCTPSVVSVNLSVSELQPNQIQILRWGHESRHRYVHGHTCACSHARRNAIHTGFGAVWCSCVALWVMSWGMRRARAGPELLRCSFVYADGFQMLASDRSATERWGAAQQFGAWASRPGLRQLYLEYLKNMALLCNNFAIVSKGWESWRKAIMITLQEVMLDINVSQTLSWLIGVTHAMCNDVLLCRSLSLIISHKI